MPQKCIIYRPSMTQSWPLTVYLYQSGFSVLFGRLITKLSKIYFVCTYVDQMKIQKRLEVLLQAQFCKCSFHYFQKFSPIFVRFMNYLKYITKYLKHSQTLVLIIIIIIYQANVVPKVSFFVPFMLSLMSTINPA